MCCNLIDHLGLPIIHINTDTHNKDKRQEQVSRIIDYIIVKGSIQYKELNQALIWLNNLIYMNYKIVTNNYLSVRSTDMTLYG